MGVSQFLEYKNGSSLFRYEFILQSGTTFLFRAYSKINIYCKILQVALKDVYRTYFRSKKIKSSARIVLYSTKHYLKHVAFVKK